jgi:hypothetical protein
LRQLTEEHNGEEMTLGQIAILVAVVYLTIGAAWILRNHHSRLATEDRAAWRREGSYWKFVVIPGAVMLLWPLAALWAWRIGRAIKTGEFDRVARQVIKEHMDKEHR